MSGVVIGIDTSCYTTSVASASLNGNIISSRQTLLKVPAGGRGLRQSDAVFEHVRNLPPLYKDILDASSSSEIIAVCASVSPRDADDSYMPVFKAGEAFASVAAATLHVPLYTTSHQRGHVRAAMIDSGIDTERFIALHLSGGTTEVILMECASLTLLGGSKDLHAGQLIDRIAVAMGLPFPGGSALEQLAIKGKDRSSIPVSVNGMSCHFSGAETQAMGWLKNNERSREDISAEIFGFISRTVVRLLSQAEKATGIHDMLVMGGVASSALLRNLVYARLAKRGHSCCLHFGPLQYSGDNAVGVALLGTEYYRAERGGYNGCSPT